jgi:hypothetical protein
VRQAKVFLYSVHKNMVLTLTLFWFRYYYSIYSSLLPTYPAHFMATFACSYYTAVSGTSLYESWVYTSFNFVLGLPIIFFGMLDRDISADFALKHPQVRSQYSATSCSVILMMYHYEYELC